MVVKKNHFSNNNNGKRPPPSPFIANAVLDFLYFEPLLSLNEIINMELLEVKGGPRAPTSNLWPFELIKVTLDFDIRRVGFLIEL